MTTAPITLPIEYWDSEDTRTICPEDENGRKIEVKYFSNIQFTGLSKHYPQPLLYSYASGTCPNAHKISKELIYLPLHMFLTDKDIKHVIKVVKKAVKR